MKLFNRNQNSTVPADLEAYTADRNDWRAWVRRIVVLAILIGIVVAIVYAGVKVFQNVTRDEPVKKPIDQAAREEKKPNNTKAPAQPAPSQNTSNPAAGGTQATPTMPKTGDDAPSQPAVLPSTGG